MLKELVKYSHDPLVKPLPKALVEYLVEGLFKCLVEGRVEASVEWLFEPLNQDLCESLVEVLLTSSHPQVRSYLTGPEEGNPQQLYSRAFIVEGRR